MERPGVLVLRPGAIGDTLLALPALRALRARFPQTRMVLVGNPSAGEVLRLTGVVDQVVDFDSPLVGQLFRTDAIGVPSELRGPWHAAIAWLSDASGVVRTNLERLGAEQTIVAASRPEASARQHVADYLLATLAPLRVRPVADTVLRLDPVQAGPEPGGPPSLALHPGSGSPAKNWPADRFARVAEVFFRQHGSTVELICGPADEKASRLFRAACRVDLGLLRGAALVEVSRRLQSCAAYLGNDSGLSHLAATLGIPCVAMFGSTDPQQWRPRGPRVVVLPFETPSEEVARVLAALAVLTQRRTAQPNFQRRLGELGTE